jgi:hypothetical protein
MIFSSQTLVSNLYYFLLGKNMNLKNFIIEFFEKPTAKIA